LGLGDFEKYYSQATQKELFDRLETGTLHPQEFRSELKKHLPASCADAAIDAAWNAMLLDLPEERVHLLDSLKKKYRLFLLSNTNQIHYDAFYAAIKTQYNRDIFADTFEKAYFSHEIKMRKPHEHTFEFVLHENRLLQAETLFIDDSIQHIQGAEKVGIHTFFLKKGESILSYFSS
jgi:putative hydrolase of the HAD superfamily